MFTQTYSSHKSHRTANNLIGIASSGIVMSISCLFWGHISDKKITQGCILTDLLEYGNEVND